jgi:hypothetical protein
VSGVIVNPMFSMHDPRLGELRCKRVIVREALTSLLGDMQAASIVITPPTIIHVFTINND